MLYYRDAESTRTDRTDTDDYLYVCSVGSNIIGPGAHIHTDYTVLRPDGRMDYHVLFVTEGHCHLDYDGQTHLLRRGDFAIYPPHTPQKYAFYCQETNAYEWVHFKGSGAAALLSSLSLCGGVYRSEGNEEIRAAFTALLREFHLKRTGYRPFSVSLLAVLLCRLGRTQDRQDLAPTEQARRHEIYNIAAAINQEPGAALSLDEYAASMHLGRDRFVHLFKAIMHTPPHRYIQSAKMAMARRLLRESSLTVSEIADALAYADPLYFSRLFHREMGLSPSAYRASMQSAP